VGAAAAVVLAASPAAPSLPDLRDLTGQPCNLPVSDALTGCPDPDGQPPVTCVLPVGPILPDAVAPACPDRDPDPRGRTVPVSR
jgi:hypothetical protein